MKIGAQFYTLRDFCKTPEALAESLKKVADIGYRTVQISGTCPYDAAWLKGELDKNGLICVVTHSTRERLRDETAALIAEHDVLGCRNIGLGFYGWDEAVADQNYEYFFRVYPRIAKEIRAGGHYFMYHNHDQEFKKVNGKLILEAIAEAYAPDELGFILDTYWTQVGGGDPAQWLEKLSGRVPCIHLKDCAYKQKMAVIGEGNINFDRVFAAAEKAGTQFMLVEQDDCYGEDPFECLKRSYQYLRSCGLE